MKNLSIGVVLVTFNRLEELKKAIPCYEGQTLAPRFIIVVDNCSTDGTREYLEEWIGKAEPCDIREAGEGAGSDAQKHPDYAVTCNTDGPVTKIVVRIPENRGGSGGFYAGLKYACGLKEADWIWVADDDAFPEPDAFEKADGFAVGHPSMIQKCSAFCGMCVSDSGKPSSLHQARIVRTIFGRQELPVNTGLFKKEYFRIDLYSFVGTFLRRESLEKAGLPVEDFFIYQDDNEHACRMRKIGRIYCVPSIVVHHNDNFAPERIVSWRDYYASRNIVIMYKWHFDRYSLWMRVVRRFLRSLVTLDKQKIRVTTDGIRDGLKNKRGLHERYRPGWIPDGSKTVPCKR